MTPRPSRRTPAPKRATRNRYGDTEGFGDPDSEGWQLFVLRDSPWEIHVRVEFVQGVPQITSLRMEPRIVAWVDPRTADEETKSRRPADIAITADTLRRLPLRTMRETATSLLLGGVADARRTFASERLERQGRTWPREHFEDVATVYRDAVDSGKGKPLVAIAERWKVSPATASKWVRQARELGVLGYPAAPGLPGYGASDSPITGSTNRPRRSK